MRSAKAIACAAMLAAILLTAAAAEAQEAFGFGDEGAPAPGAAAPAGSGPSSGIRLGGSLEIGGELFFDPMDDIGDNSLGDLYSARISIVASGSKVDAAIKLKASKRIFEERPADVVDEARLRISSGALTLEGGLMKLSWGKADSLGPLDVLNPLDLSDLTITDSLERRIARPMIRAAFAIGQSSMAEAVFLPGFEGMRVATGDRWKPDQIAAIDAQISNIASILNGYGDPRLNNKTYADLLPDYGNLKYSQAGARFTTSPGSIDLGFQYFYGFIAKPAAAVTFSPLPDIALSYNRCHQVGADFAAVLAGFNLRGELAANLTEDLEGDDPTVYNPALAFSLGFDRGLPAGFSLNLQYAGTYRLGDDGISSSFDIEYGADAFSSNLTAVLSKSLFKDALKLEATALWEIADGDFLIIPSAAYAAGDAELKLSAGIFGGDAEGPLGQYADSSYVKATIGYKF